MAYSMLLIGLFVGGYVSVCGFFLYFCVLADPEDSEVAFLIQVAIPRKIWGQMFQVLGEKKMNIVKEIGDRLLVFIYLFVVLGCWTVVFWYIYPWITASKSVSNVHKYVGYLVFIGCFGSWRLCHKSSPGIITLKSFKRFDHYPYDNLLFQPNRRCETTKLIRIPRSKFDRMLYNQNVPRYDHFCGWVFNTIGGENYRWFLLFLVVHVVMCSYGSSVCILLFLEEIREKKLMELVFFDRSTGLSIRSSPFIVGQYLFTGKTWESGVLVVMFVMGIALLCFLSYHLYLTSVNQTTNENGKWTDIKKWHAAQKRRHAKALKEGLIKPTPADGEAPPTAETPEVRDGEVTCTGGAAPQAKQEKDSHREQSEQQYFDPGPLPKNIYDRGFVENWKEVLFPLSRRKNALQLGGYSRQAPRPPKQGQTAAVEKVKKVPPPQAGSDKKD